MKFKISIIAIAGLAALAVSAISASQDITRSVWDGVYTSDQAKRGQGLYAVNCAPCHGDQLDGGEGAPALTGSEFMGAWGGQTVGGLFDRIRSTMPADRPGTLSREENAAILAYILQSNKFPAGTTELAHESEVLKQIHLEAKKPKK